MSCFQGIMNEYKQISLDKFTGKNLESTVYFLSHCHKDHMDGLDSDKFFTRMKESKLDVKLYTSKISRDILVNDDKYRHLESFIVIIEIEAPRIIKIPSNNNEETEVTVTLLSAGHCPGSVMFLFEGNEGTVLYTGDFRWRLEDASRCRYLKSGRNVKNIQSLYLDSTFCVQNFFRIPQRTTSCDSLIEFTKKRLRQTKNSVVRLILPAQYGYEYLFIKLYKALNVKIHVDSNKMSKFLGVESIIEATTENPNARIHACFSNSNSNMATLPCGYSFKNMNVTSIKISAMWFEGFQEITEPLVFDDRDKIYRLFYSTHSSLEEVCDFVSILNAENVYLNVIPAKSSEKEVLEILNKYRNNKCSEEKPVENTVVALDTLTREQSYSSQSSQSNDLLFDVDLCSPAKKNIFEIHQTTNSKTDLIFDDNSPKTPNTVRSDKSDSDSTPDEFTPDPKASPTYSFKNNKLCENQAIKRRKLFSD